MPHLPQQIGFVLNLWFVCSWYCNWVLFLQAEHQHQIILDKEGTAIIVLAAMCWNGTHGGLVHHADYPGLMELYKDWSEGIMLSLEPLRRQWPLRDLERRLKAEKAQHPTPWRSGTKMRGAIAERLTLIYAILRELPHPASRSLFIAHMQHIHAKISAILCTVTHVVIKLGLAKMLHAIAVLSANCLRYQLLIAIRSATSLPT